MTTQRTATLTGSAPVLLVRDLEASVAHYRDALGFERVTTFGDPIYFAIARRDGCAIMLRLADDPNAVVPLWKVQDKLVNAYFWVDDAEALYRELQERGATIDYELYDTSYGVREFGINDVDGYDIAFGQPLR